MKSPSRELRQEWNHHIGKEPNDRKSWYCPFPTKYAFFSWSTTVTRTRLDRYINIPISEKCKIVKLPVQKGVDRYSSYEDRSEQSSSWWRNQSSFVWTKKWLAFCVVYGSSPNFCTQVSRCFPQCSSHAQRGERYFLERLAFPELTNFSCVMVDARKETISIWINVISNTKVFVDILENFI